MKNPAIYMIINQRNGILYIGVTSNLIKRIWEHQNKVIGGFSKRYNLDILVYYEMHDTIEGDIIRETQMKRWKKDWKLNLIESHNPLWDDLYEGLTGCLPSQA